MNHIPESMERSSLRTIISKHPTKRKGHTMSTKTYKVDSVIKTRKSKGEPAWIGEQLGLDAEGVKSLLTFPEFKIGCASPLRESLVSALTEVFNDAKLAIDDCPISNEEKDGLKGAHDVALAECLANVFSYHCQAEAYQTIRSIPRMESETPAAPTRDSVEIEGM